MTPREPHIAHFLTVNQTTGHTQHGEMPLSRALWLFAAEAPIAVGLYNATLPDVAPYPFLYAHEQPLTSALWKDPLAPILSAAAETSGLDDLRLAIRPGEEEGKELPVGKSPRLEPHGADAHELVDVPPAVEEEVAGDERQ